MASVKTGDVGVPLNATLTDADGNEVDLQGATIRVLMRRRGDDFLIADDAANLQVGDGEDGSKGDVAYTWTAEATDPENVGLYFTEWEVTYQDLSIQTFPAADWNLVAIVEDNDSQEGS